ncbi:MAG: aromatic ring-hydroxylating dioxygenase subunit alpha [Pseudomonadota bacterium]
MAHADEMLSLLMARKPKHTLPQPLYNDPDLYQVDLEMIFYRDWLLAGPTCEIPKAGAYLTVQVGAYSVVVVRGADRKIRAFHNVCRHRGSRLCTAERGSAPKLVCPYHQWTYELDGRLLWARDMGEDFDLAANGLKPVQCRIAGGLIFICLAEHPPAFDALAEIAETYFAPYEMDTLKVAHSNSIVEQANWKLVMENNRECYHCAGTHPSLSVSFSDSPHIGGDGSGVGDPMIVDHHKRCEAAGLPAKLQLAPNEQWRFLRVPLLGEAVSYTSDGGQAVEQLIGRMPFRNSGSLMFFHFPTSWNHFLSDCITTFRLLPLSPQETLVTTRWLVNKDAVEGVDYDVERLTEVWTQTNNEDRAIVEENQRGVNSPAYEPGPYSELQESGVIQFVDWYASTMISRLTGRAMIAAE